MGTYLAFGWLVVLVLGANAGIPIPDGFGMAVFFVTFASVIYLFVRMRRRWPVVGWLGLGLIVGLFGGGYHSHATTVVEHEYELECDSYNNCDNCDNESERSD